MKFELTIAVLTYNHERFITDCLNGIFRQDINFKTEIIISDDFSLDNTNHLVYDFIKSHSKRNFTFTHLKSKKNMGPRRNFNKVMSNVKSRYVAICDGDDVWTDAFKIKKQYKELQLNSKLVLSCHNYNFISENNIILKTTRYKRIVFNRDMIFGKNAINVQPSTVLFKYYPDLFFNSSIKSTGFNYDLNRILTKGDGLYLDSIFCSYRTNENGQFYSKTISKRLEISLTNQVQIYFDKKFTDKRTRKRVLMHSIYLIGHSIFFLLIKFQLNELYNCLKMIKNLKYKP